MMNTERIALTKLATALRRSGYTTQADVIIKMAQDDPTPAEQPYTVEVLVAGEVLSEDFLGNNAANATLVVVENLSEETAETLWTAFVEAFKGSNGVRSDKLIINDDDMEGLITNLKGALATPNPYTPTLMRQTLRNASEHKGANPVRREREWTAAFNMVREVNLATAQAKQKKTAAEQAKKPWYKPMEGGAVLAIVKNNILYRKNADGTEKEIPAVANDVVPGFKDNKEGWSQVLSEIASDWEVSGDTYKKKAEEPALTWDRAKGMTMPDLAGTFGFEIKNTEQSNAFRAWVNGGDWANKAYPNNPGVKTAVDKGITDHFGSREGLDAPPSAFWNNNWMKSAVVTAGKEYKTYLVEQEQPEQPAAKQQVSENTQEGTGDTQEVLNIPGDHIPVEAAVILAGGRMGVKSEEYPNTWLALLDVAGEQKPYFRAKINGEEVWSPIENRAVYKVKGKALGPPHLTGKEQGSLVEEYRNRNKKDNNLSRKDRRLKRKKIRDVARKQRRGVKGRRYLGR